MQWRRCLVLPLLSIFGGCSDHVAPVLHEPAEAARLAIETYDANADGVIGGSEFEESPALASALERADLDGDGNLSEQEIQSRLEAYQTQSQRIGTIIRLEDGRKPLDGATVILEMESFLGDGLPVYQGAADRGGKVTLTRNGESAPMVPVGLYRVRIKRSGSDQETLRGCEIADDVPGVNSVVFDAKRR